VSYVVVAYALVIGALAAYGLSRAREARRLRRALLDPRARNEVDNGGVREV
jgi:hypothetical protein